MKPKSFENDKFYASQIEVIPLTVNEYFND